MCLYVALEVECVWHGLKGNVKFLLIVGFGSVLLFVYGAQLHMHVLFRLYTWGL